MQARRRAPLLVRFEPLSSRGPVSVDRQGVARPFRNSAARELGRSHSRRNKNGAHTMSNPFVLAVMKAFQGKLPKPDEKEKRKPSAEAGTQAAADSNEETASEDVEAPNKD